MRVPTLRLQKNLVAFLLGETHHLVLDRRTIARPDPFDDAAIHRRLIEVSSDDLVGSGVGVGDPAGELFHVELRVAPWVQSEKVVRALDQGVCHETELRHRVVAVLPLALREINRSAIQAAGRAGLEALDGEAKAFQCLRDIGSRVAHPPAFFVSQTHVHQPAHESPGAQNDRAPGNFHAERSGDSSDPVALHQQIRRRCPDGSPRRAWPPARAFIRNW